MSTNHANRAKLAKHDWVSAESHTSSDGMERLAAAAAELDHLRTATNDALGAVVVTSGACLLRMDNGDRPGWLFDDLTSTATAAPVCAACPVRRECLELELRLFGDGQHGMWGSLGENGRRELHPVWADRRAHNDTTTTTDGDTLSRGAR